MPEGTILRKWNRRAAAADSLLCVGLDSEWARLPARFRASAQPQFEFNKWIIDQTAEFAAALKLNTAFYEARGAQGWAELQLTAEYLRASYPEHLTICDAKRADIGNTNLGYVNAVFDAFGFDTITLHPYLGQEALQPFLVREDKGSIVLCRTSNPGAGEFQDLRAGGKPVWEHIAEAVNQRWNKRGNCMLVVGATYPEEMRRIRELAPALTFLVPGIGAQGGDLNAVMAAGLDSQGRGLIISSSRGILFAEDPAEAARNTRDAIRRAKEAALAQT